MAQKEVIPLSVVIALLRADEAFVKIGGNPLARREFEDLQIRYSDFPSKVVA